MNSDLKNHLMFVLAFSVVLAVILSSNLSISGFQVLGSLNEEKSSSNYRVLSPSGINLLEGKNSSIVFDAKDFDSKELTAGIYYSKFRGKKENLIAESIELNESICSSSGCVYSWNSASVPTGSYYIDLTVSDGTSVFSHSSESGFKIIPQISVINKFADIVLTDEKNSVESALFEKASKQFTVNQSERKIIQALNVFEGSARFFIEPEPNLFELNLNESKKIDLDKDSISDIELTLNSIYRKQASFGIKLIKEIIPGAIPGTVSAENLCSNVSCNDSNPCTSNSCVEGKCSYTALPEGYSCGNGNVCLRGNCVELKKEVIEEKQGPAFIRSFDPVPLILLLLIFAVLFYFFKAQKS